MRATLTSLILYLGAVFKRILNGLQGDWQGHKKSPIQITHSEFVFLMCLKLRMGISRYQEKQKWENKKLFSAFTPKLQTCIRADSVNSPDYLKSNISKQRPEWYWEWKRTSTGTDSLQKGLKKCSGTACNTGNSKSGLRNSFTTHIYSDQERCSQWFPNTLCSNQL